jgi:SOS response regulatory protein OraA/RecX
MINKGRNKIMKKLHKKKPCVQLQALRQAIKDDQAQQHRFIMMQKRFNITIPADKEEADHYVLALIAKGNKYWLERI